MIVTDRLYLRDAAIHWAAMRDRAYPPLIEARKLAQADAVAKLELARCLAAQWRWATADMWLPLPPAAAHGGRFNADPVALFAEIADAAERARSLAEAAPDSWERAELARLYASLRRWQADDAGEPRIVALVDAERRFKRQLHPDHPRAARLREAA